MKKIFLGLFLNISILFSNTYMAKIEPFEKSQIKSQSSGVVEFVNKKLEAQFIKMNETLIKINSTDEQIELKKQENSLKIQKEIVKIKEKNFTLKNKISQLSRYEKDSEKLSFLESKKEQILLEEEIKRLRNEISKKRLDVENKYVHKIYVNNFEYVNISDLLYEIYDISKLKISLYLKLDEIKQLSKKSVYINGKKSDFKTYKINRLKDEIRVSRYKVEFIKNNENREKNYFNQLVKVELR